MLTEMYISGKIEQVVFKEEYKERRGFLQEAFRVDRGCRLKTTPVSFMIKQVQNDTDVVYVKVKFVESVFMLKGGRGMTHVSTG